MNIFYTNLKTVTLISSDGSQPHDAVECCEHDHREGHFLPSDFVAVALSHFSIRFNQLIIAVPESYDVNALVIWAVVHLPEVYRYVSIVCVSSQRLSVDAKQSAHFLDAIPSLKVHIWLYVGHCHT